MSNPTNSLGRVTRKLYYEDYRLKSTEANVVAVKSGAIELDRTIAFPEGGGQEADHGRIITADGRVIRFNDTRKRYGRPLFLPEFPTINVDTIIYHLVEPEDEPILEGLAPGDTVQVQIDVDRRARLTLSHTASHLVYLATEQTRPDATANTRGCHIKEDSARFDFGVSDRFDAEQIERITAIAEGFVQRDAQVSVYPHPDEPEALYWECEGQVMPCGGTHLSHAGPIGRLAVRRKNLGKGTERLIITFPEATINPADYHE